MAMLELIVLLTTVSVGRAAEETQTGPRMLRGLWQTVVKVNEGSITVELVPTDAEAAKQVTVAISAERTKVSVAEVTETKKSEDGTFRTHVIFKAGKLADLKVGQKVTVMVDDGVAREIRVMPSLSERGKDSNTKAAPTTMPAKP